MKIPGAHFQMLSNKYTNFRKNPWKYFLEHAWTKSCPQTEVRLTGRQTDMSDSVKQYTPELRSQVLKKQYALALYEIDNTFNKLKKL